MTSDNQMYELRMMLLGRLPDAALQSFSQCGVIDMSHKSKAELSHMVIALTERLDKSYKSNKEKSSTITKLRSEVSTLKTAAQKQ